MKKLLLVLPFIAGCANSSSVYLADGSQGHALDCSGTARSWNMCLEKAGELCGARGYQVMTRDGEFAPIAVASAGGGQFGAFGSASIYRNMTIRCGR